MIPNRALLLQLPFILSLSWGCASISSKATAVAANVVSTATDVGVQVASNVANTSSTATLVVVSTATDVLDEAASTTGAAVNHSVATIGEHTGLSTLVKAGSQMTPRESYSLGRICASKILSTREPVRIEAVANYIDTLGKYLSLHSKNPYTYKGFQFVLVDGEKPYAVSTPGGFIFISTGMVALADTEDELAAVLAHEIGHVSLRHAEAAIQIANRLDLYGGMLLKTASYATDFATKATRLDQVKVLHDFKVIQMLNVFDTITDFVLNEGFNQSQELDADLEAAHILRSAGYSTKALETMVAKFSDGFSLGALHPGSTERVEALREALPQVKGEALPQLRDLAGRQQEATTNALTQRRFKEAKAKLFRYDFVSDRY